MGVVEIGLIPAVLIVIGAAVAPHLRRELRIKRERDQLYRLAGFASARGRIDALITEHGEDAEMTGTVQDDLVAARNEIVAFQVIVEADGKGVARLGAALPRLTGPSGNEIEYRAPDADPTVSVGRPIQLFAVHYMHVAMPSYASWVYRRGSPAAPPDPTGWKPVQLVPERASKGGLPIAVGPDLTQSIWIEIYTGRGRPAGLYTGEVVVDADGARRAVPIELELLDLDLPDRNSMHAMLYY